MVETMVNQKIEVERVNLRREIEKEFEEHSARSKVGKGARQIQEGNDK